MIRKPNRPLLSAAAQFIEQLESRTLLATDGYGYTATAIPVEPINLTPTTPGVTLLLSNTHDDLASIDLGASTFNFYGKIFTGDRHLLITSNGLITFDSVDLSPINTNLTQVPSDRAIAPLWDDWIVGLYGLPGQVLSKFEDTGGSSAPDRLIIQWTGVHYPFSNTPLNIPKTLPSVLFQAILQLNTGSTPGNIIFNYINLNTGHRPTNQGASATVGIKDIDSQGSNRILVSMNSKNHLVGSGKAILLSDPTPPLRANADGPQTVNLDDTATLDASATTDIHQSTTTLNYAWDLDDDGIFGETGANASDGDEIGIRTALSPTFGGGEYSITLRVTDKFGSTSFDSTIINFVVITPTAKITAPADIFAGVPATFTLSASPVHSPYFYDVNWDDFNAFPDFLNAPGGADISVTHTYNLPRSYTIDVTYRSDLADGIPVDLPITVTPRPNAQLVASSGILVVTTGSGNDTIVVDQSHSKIRLNRNGVITNYPLADVKSLNIQSGDGNDSIQTPLDIPQSIVCGDGNSTITAGNGDDTILTGNGNNLITTGSGADSVSTGIGAETISTGDGNDTIDAGGDADAHIGTTINSGAGDDLISTAYATSITGGLGNDIIGATLVGTVDASGGNDRIEVGSNAAHPALIFGGKGNDTIYTTDGPDSIYGGAGLDRIYAGAGADLVSGNGGNDRLFGQGGNDRLYGEAGQDRLEGSAGDDRLFGGTGADHIDGGTGINAAPHNDPLDQLLNIQNDLT
jgi:Ca2+-binding RTX toxin-like protein